MRTDAPLGHERKIPNIKRHDLAPAQRRAETEQQQGAVAHVDPAGAEAGDERTQTVDGQRTLALLRDADRAPHALPGRFHDGVRHRARVPGRFVVVRDSGDPAADRRGGQRLRAGRQIHRDDRRSSRQRLVGARAAPIGECPPIGRVCRAGGRRQGIERRFFRAGALSGEVDREISAGLDDDGERGHAGMPG
jgi:hypothetical protein